MCVFGDLSRLIISDMRVKSSDKHERVVHEFLDSFSIWFDVFETVESEGV